MTNSIIKLALAVAFAAFACTQAVEVTVEWDPAQKTIDGNPLENVSGYKVYYGETSGQYSDSVFVTNGTSADLELEYNKAYYFSVKTYTADANSDFSDELVWNAPAMKDENANGICDDWEIFHFGNLVTADRSTDSDGDGVSDLNEFIAGTNPSDALDYPYVTIEEGLILSFETRSVSGEGYQNRIRSYSLEFCDDLVSADWTPVSDLDQIAASGQIVRHEISAGSRPGFYRTQIELN